MAEIEIHHETGHEGHDPFGQTIGIAAAVIGVFLAVVTIQSHRAHTSAVILKTEANDKWAYYQAKSIKRSEYAIAGEMAKLINSSAEGSATAAKFNKEKERYQKETEDIQTEAKQVEEETKKAEAQALRYDLGEGLLELGLVLSSLYFISRKKLFPYIGIFSAVAGTVITLTGFLLG